MTFPVLVRQINNLSETLASQRLEVIEHQLLLAKVISQIDVAIVAIDDNHKVSLANPAAAKLFNLEVEEITQSDATRLNLQSLFDNPDQTVIEWSFPHQSGKFSIHTDKFIEGGKTSHLLFITDVRDLLRTEERKTWQNLIRVLSHEINNSLTPISSLSQTLGKLISNSDNLSEDKPDILDGLNIVRERANSLKTFIVRYWTGTQQANNRSSWRGFNP